MTWLSVDSTGAGSIQRSVSRSLIRQETDDCTDSTWQTRQSLHEPRSCQNVKTPCRRQPNDHLRLLYLQGTSIVLYMTGGHRKPLRLMTTD